MLRIKFSLFLLFLSTLVFAQKNGDAADTSLKPEWTVSTPGPDYKLHGKISTDSSGNTFVTGSFLRSISSTDNKVLKSKIDERSFYIAMYNKEGKLQWVQIHEGKSKGTALATHKGFVYVTGIVNTSHRFTSSDPATSDSIRLTGELSGAAAFIAKYDYKGKLIWARVPEKFSKLETTGLSIESSNRFVYVSGTLPQGYVNGQENTAAVVLKFTMAGTLHSSVVSAGDNPERAEGVAVGSSGYYTTGCFKNITQFSGITVKGESDRNTFIAKYNYLNQIQWIISSEGKAEVWAKDIVCDSKGNAYVYGSFQGMLKFSDQKEVQKEIRSVSEDVFIAKFSPQGNLLWVQTVSGKSSESATSIIVDLADNIYICGQSAMGATFSTAGSEIKKFTSSDIGGTDYFIASYNSDGLLLWMKADTKKGLDYCNAIGVDKNSNMYLLVNATLLLKFSKKSLESPDVVPPPTAPKFKEEDYRDCKCAEGTNRNLGLPQPLKDMVNYKTFTELTGFKMAPGKINAYEYVYCADLKRYGTRSTTELNMNLISLAFFRINLSNALTLDLTPCYDGRPVEIPATFSKEQKILQYVPEFDINNFTRTPREYYDVIINAYYQLEAKKLLSRVVFDFDDNSSGKDFVERVNAKYKTKIKPDKNKKKETIEDMIDQLQKKNVTIFGLIYDEFIGIHVKKGEKGLNEKVEDLLTRLFSELGMSSEQNLNNLIYPQYKANLSVNKIGIVFPLNILRRWDYFKNKVMKDSLGNFFFAKTVMETNSLEYNSEGELNVNGKFKTCFTLSEISNTGILFDFRDAALDLSEDPHARIDYRYRMDGGYEAHPFHLISKATKTAETALYPDTLLEKFTGLLIKDGSFRIPIKDTLVTVKGSNILLNNYFISGNMQIPLVSYVDKVFTLEYQTRKISVTEKELNEIFSKKGMQFKFKVDKETRNAQDILVLTIYFNYTAY